VRLCILLSLPDSESLSNAVNSVKKFVIVLALLVVLAAGTLLLYSLFIQAPINLPTVTDESIRIALIVGFWLTILFVIRRAKPVMATHFGDQPATIVQIFIGGIAVLVMVFAVLHVLGVSAESLLTGAGIASLTVGLIVSTFVGNTLAGALVFATHRLRVGDNVMFTGVPGTIVDMSALVTRVRTDVGHVTVPNSAIASGAVIITKIHAHAAGSLSRLPYAQGDRVVTTYIQGEGTVREISSLYTRILLDSGKELTLLNNSVLVGSVAVAKVTPQNQGSQ
jgi:small-conductance mechanosensitive channel